MDGSLLAFSIIHKTSLIFTPQENELIQEAIEMASYLHRHDTRANRGRLPRDNYITHPLRNTLRILRYGCTDIDVIIASILHDTVEDHPKEISIELAGKEAHSVAEARDNSFSYITAVFGAEVSRIVAAVSNPEMPAGLSKEEKRKLYAEHVISVLDDPKVFLVKFSDFVDNAVGLYHNTGSPEMVSHLSRKYIQLVNAFRYRMRSELGHYLPVTPNGLDEMKRHLNIGETRLQKLISE